MNRTGLRYAAGALALAVAAIHVYWAFPRLVVQIQAGMVPDPRPIVFVGSGAAIVLGIAQVLDGRNPKPIYLAGIALMVAYLVGYAAWHTVLGHAGWWPWGPDAIHYHDQSAAEVVLEHLLANPLELLSKALELLLAAALAALYRLE